MFGRCLGADSPETRAAQKTKFGCMRYAQAAQVTEDSRLLYLLLKMLKNRAPANQLTSPSKVTASLKGQYKRIADRVRDDPILGGLAIPLPNLNAKSISTFAAREEKKAKLRATVLLKVTPHLKVLSDAPFPEAPALPTSLPPARPASGPVPSIFITRLEKGVVRSGGKCHKHFVHCWLWKANSAHVISILITCVFYIFILFVEEPEPVPPVNRPVQPTASSSSTRPRPAASTHLQPRPAAPTYGPPPV